MPIITLTSDWNNEDYYIAAIKGQILSTCPEMTIVDISHKIQSFSISQAAFVVRHSYFNFPENSVHIIAVNSESGPEKPLIALRAMNHYFIGCNNGIFMLILDKEPDEVVELPEKLKNKSKATPIDVFAHTACELAGGKSISEIGKRHINLKRQIPMLPTIDESVINGSIIYIDSYRNAITNITGLLFEKIKKKRKFDIYIQSNHYKVNKINRLYAESSVGELLVLINSIGYLEIAINSGRAADLLNLTVGSPVRVRFYD